MARRGTVTVLSGGLGAAEVGVGVLVNVAGGEVGSVEEIGVSRGGSDSVAQASPLNPRTTSVSRNGWYLSRTFFLAIMSAGCCCYSGCRIGIAT